MARRRKSSIQRLDPRVKEAVDAAIREGRATIDELVALIAQHGGSASRSAVGRYVRSAEQQMARYREAQEVARTWIGRIEADPAGDVGRLLSEMLRTVALQQIDSIEDGSATPKDTALLARAIHSLASADKVSVERALRLRREAATAAAAAADQVARREGLQPSTVQELRRAILGVAE